MKINQPEDIIAYGVSIAFAFGILLFPIWGFIAIISHGVCK